MHGEWCYTWEIRWPLFNDKGKVIQRFVLGQVLSERYWV